MGAEVVQMGMAAPDKCGGDGWSSQHTCRAEQQSADADEDAALTEQAGEFRVVLRTVVVAHHLCDAHVVADKHQREQETQVH